MPPRGIFYKTQWPKQVVGCQINPIDVNFYLQKGLEIIDLSIGSTETKYIKLNTKTQNNIVIS